MGILQLALILFWAVAVAGIAWYLATIAGEVTYVTLADGRKQARALPMMFKALLPFVGNLDRLFSGSAFSRQVDAAKEMLVSGGFEGLLTGKEFVGLKILTPLVFGTSFGLAILAAGMFIPAVREFAPMAIVMAFALTYLYPMMWLKGAVKRRHLSIQKSLPFVLDLLTLSVEAGMDFISALQRNCQTRKLDPLNEELLRMTKEIQVGSSRKTALRNMAARVNQSDLRSVAFALIQADELGVSIGSILRIQSEQLRSRRFDRAEKLAAEAPVKMLGPLMLCIFPAVFIILLGPVLSQAMKGIF